MRDKNAILRRIGNGPREACDSDAGARSSTALASADHNQEAGWPLNR